jgi:PadR family transcriptional regulator PadR
MNRRYLDGLDRAILQAILSLGEDAYGVPIMKVIQAAGKNIGVGTLYVALSRLEREGYIIGREVHGDYPERGGRPRMYYTPAIDLVKVLSEEKP